MRKIFTLLSLFMVSLALYAIPAKPHLWKTIRLNDGTEMRAQLKGDEFGHYWQATNGLQYVATKDGYMLKTLAMQNFARERRMAAQRRRTQRAIANRKAMRRDGAGSAYTGEKKGLIILVNFKDVKFRQGHDQALYNKIANQKDYASSEGFVGSVSDYFRDQSLNQFELTFDVVGPVTVSKNMSYYGGNDSQGNDQHPEQMVSEAVKLAKSSVSDWSKYDWDGDSYIDQVMIIYAGEGEASGGDDNTIWPHEWDLLSSGTSLVDVGNAQKSLYVNTYAVANEVDDDGDGGYILTGIGSICHEFSHCLGLPDMYDTNYGGNFGMGTWSLMDNGSYNGSGFCPAGYTSYERLCIGWMKPIELTEAQAVTNMPDLISSGLSYRITNGGNPDEYYLLENRQFKSWDKELLSAGLLVLHVDHDDDLIYYNLVNTVNEDSSLGPLNDHQRCTIFHADGTDYNAIYSELMDEADELGDYEAYDEYLDLYWEDMSFDTYPQPTNNQLTNTSTPRAFTYNANTDGRKLMNVSITEITQNADGTMAFVFGLDNSGTAEGDNTDYGVESDEPVTPTGDYLFYESFNKCAGTGGNDNKWQGSIANKSMDLKTVPDNKGWSAENGAYVADKCAKFGTGSKDGIAVTPAFTVNGTATLTFKAAAWNALNDGTTLKLSVSNGSITPANVIMNKGKWKDFTATITATGNVKVTFKAQSRRFFLDEVLAVDPNASAIQHIAAPAATATDSRIFTLDGRYVGTGRDQLSRGIYIVNGRKFVVK